jgi:TfoX/Sxy family transcriptional regulator of competence genes
MAFSEALAERIRDALARKWAIEEKKMFGGIGFLLNGNLLVGVWKDSLIVRLGPDEGDEALKEPHVKEFDITGRAMMGWVLVEPEGVEDDEQLSAWIQRAVKFVAAFNCHRPCSAIQQFDRNPRMSATSPTSNSWSNTVCPQRRSVCSGMIRCSVSSFSYICRRPVTSASA